MTKVIDLIHVRGDSFEQRLALTTGIASTFDEVWFTVRSTEPSSSIVDDTDALSSGTLTGGEIVQTGQYEWTVTINTPNWPVGRLVYDVQVRSGSGQIFTLIRGKMRVYADITRST